MVFGCHCDLGALLHFPAASAGLAKATASAARANKGFMFSLRNGLRGALFQQRIGVDRRRFRFAEQRG
jgi:hypothetical protein